ncbi:hypothetical protein M011DRAFT_456842 [Sporormia fimetaria CBS 119925]|uniref:Rhodopsin domain-containing protein n=1 Tax=Sporormia fimetaria CBS 119925 TaxID=1340428 RepID=A0A6A6VFG3_9PLEO|nr:hypothetical protein M011DRAFT_456842 [Sporormia fimetaria CBS 119925]
MSTTPPPFPPEYLNADKGPQALAIIIVFPSLALVIVALRFYTRRFLVNSISHEDLTILAALIFSIATSICQAFQVKNGMGRHIQALTMEQGINSLKALFASIMMYNFGLTLTKISIVLQYIRIAHQKSHLRWCWALFWITILHCIDSFVTGVLSCYPVPKFWDDRIPGGCVNKPALWYANAAINIIQDIWLVALPIFILRKLFMPRREKIVLMLILGLGGFACCASVIRLNALHTVATSQDITWDNPGTATWSTIELNVGIICASLPTLRALFAKYFPRFFSSSVLSRGNVGNGYRSNGYSRKRNSVSHDGTLLDGTIHVKNEVDVDVESAKNEGPFADSSSDTALRAPPSAFVR